MSSVLGQVGHSFAAGILPGVGLLAYTAISCHLLNRAKVEIKSCEQNALFSETKGKSMLANFKLAAIKGPILEELAFRGLMQSCVTLGVESVVPDLAQHVTLGMPLSHAASAVITGVVFGAMHLPNYEKGGAIWFATQGVVGGTAFGILREMHGIPAAISAHMLFNTAAFGWNTYLLPSLEQKK